ncbi:hypothetical protein CHGG_10862 [Chaetomium globosum CBS 148.51]|uniref:Cytochrome b5 heme-binding domain-containing protein n=1 Tax=Chaetomium globosum (strain ATCC 6205 / CBS 148.51 / DSM 1962 / NBRC 6347 / NRRL 1970) TaxID=306901 RepID=Q2GME2_CHAGB|nr:uncharacterized protein CHGG_10862 [Chaetomium globosum CBS 148.51]EAQ83044.1 hypothetical protein CHGG_10862 [Chaetomium globosum CBS 148.51]
MALLGISLILASVVLFCMRRPAWFSSLFGGPSPPSIEPAPSETKPDDSPVDADGIARDEPSHATNGANGKAAAGQTAMPPPPVIQHTAPGPDTSGRSPDDDEQTTPKASATTLTTPVPALALSTPEPTPTVPRINGLSPAAPARAPTSSLMPPPPRPPTLRPPSSGITSTPSLAPPRGRPLPRPSARTTRLFHARAAPPPHSSKPDKPSRAVVLTPGHSPLDWARLSGDPSADLRGLPAGSPYLRVTPSMLKRMTGRRGKDAWTVLGGRVYNMTPYLPFHPGGEPELLRAAARDGTRLFGEIHPVGEL